MTINIFNALDVLPQPWKNGGGKTRELLTWPSANEWTIRISLADIDADGAFSTFPETLRWFSVVEGAGVHLNFSNQPIALSRDSQPFAFDGLQTPYCRLVNGSTRDLNLMVKRQAINSTEMTVVKNTGDNIPETWHAKYQICALFTTVAGLWSNDRESKSLNPYDFLCSIDHGPQIWSFTADEPITLIGNQENRAWWLGANASEI
jgi:environmental stress-induced protein Ves